MTFPKSAETKLLLTRQPQCLLGGQGVSKHPCDGIDDDCGQDIVRGGDAFDGEFRRGDALHHLGQCLA